MIHTTRDGKNLSSRPLEHLLRGTAVLGRVLSQERFEFGAGPPPPRRLARQAFAALDDET